MRSAPMVMGCMAFPFVVTRISAAEKHRLVRAGDTCRDADSHIVGVAKYGFASASPAEIRSEALGRSIFTNKLSKPEMYAVSQTTSEST